MHHLNTSDADATHVAAGIEGAADSLYYAIYPGDEVRGPRPDLHEYAQKQLSAAVQAMGKVGSALAPGIGQPDPRAARDAAVEASDLIESTSGIVKLLPHDVVVARADALRVMDAIAGRG